MCLLEDQLTSPTYTGKGPDPWWVVLLKFRTISHMKILILALNYIGTVQGPYGHSEEGFYETPE